MNWVRKFPDRESCCLYIPSRNGLLQVKMESILRKVRSGRKRVKVEREGKAGQSDHRALPQEKPEIHLVT